jgi:hypothetical protein
MDQEASQNFPTVQAGVAFVKMVFATVSTGKQRETTIRD